MKSNRHPPVIRVLHWSVALMVIAALVMSAFVMSRIPDEDPEKLAAALRHMSVGFLVCLAMIARLFFRRRAQRPPALSSGMPWADVLAGLVHRLLDVMVLAMVLSGLWMAIETGLPWMALSGGHFPAGLASLPAHAIHVAVAWALAAALVLHVGGALFHQFILRDGLITRMGFDAGSIPSLRRLLPRVSGRDA